MSENVYSAVRNQFVVVPLTFFFSLELFSNNIDFVCSKYFFFFEISLLPAFSVMLLWTTFSSPVNRCKLKHLYYHKLWLVILKNLQQLCVMRFFKRVMETNIWRIQTDSPPERAHRPGAHKHEHRGGLGPKWEDFSDSFPCCCERGSRKSFLEDMYSFCSPSPWILSRTYRPPRCGKSSAPAAPVSEGLRWSRALKLCAVKQRS